MVPCRPTGWFAWSPDGANGYRDGPGTEAMFRYPLDVALAADGTCYVADTGNDCIRAIYSDGMVATIARSNYDFGDGYGPDARFRRPAALDVDDEGVCWVADTGKNAIGRVTPDGVVTTLAGEPPGGDQDVSGRCVGLRWPMGITVKPDGSVWVADHGNGALRHITATGETTTRLRLSGLCWPVAVARSGDGSVAVAGSALDDGRVPEACVMGVSNPH